MESELDILCRRQEALIALIFSEQSMLENKEEDQMSKGLKIYQNNLLMTAVRALSLKYPVIDKMIGREALSGLTRKLLHIEFPASGDWADWGEQLSSLIMTTELYDQHPYLAEIASFEWCLHETARGVGTELNVNALARLSEQNLKSVFIQLSKTLKVLSFHYPVDEIWMLHQLDESQIDTNELAVLLKEPIELRRIVMYQREAVPCVERLTEQEQAWLIDVLAGLSLDQLLEKYVTFDLSGWLSVAIEEQWLEGLR
jgi:hypothetical protein